MEYVMWWEYVVLGLAGVGILFLAVKIGGVFFAWWDSRPGKVHMDAELLDVLEDLDQGIVRNAEMITLLCEDVGKLKGLINVEPVVSWNSVGSEIAGTESCTPPKKKRGRPRKQKLN